ncbi:MAG: ParB/RepB/Spo0J family partition protein [Candidatus Omnitrophica bacterium]|nr:ParB/RepB/Spo0J family partition protein [Candidatus Omnitrophota bacterium]
MDRKVLGKGLDALIPKKPSSLLPKEFTYLPLNKILPAKNQPRQNMAEEELAELAQSIKQKGFIQPVVVRRKDNGYYEIVAGERRFLASKSLGLNEIPAMVKDVNDKEAFVLAIIENLQRKDLNPIEEARALSRLIAEYSFSLSDIAEFVGKNKTTVVNSLRLLKLPENIQQALIENKITRTQARTILGIENLIDQEKLFQQIISEKLSVREIEKKARLVSKRKKQTDPFIQEAENRLQMVLGTKVKIHNKKNNKGRLIIEYYNLKDLERIIKKIK